MAGQDIHRPAVAADPDAPARSPFPRFQRRREEAANGWEPVDLGGHEVVSRLHMELKAGPQAVREGRHALDPLEGAIGEEELGNLRLLVTELVSNSVRHSQSTSWIGLDVDIYSNSVHVRVTDRGPGFVPDEHPQPHADRPGGWGLCLVDILSDRWGVIRDGLTSVWFEMDRSERDYAAVS
jgi:anti-sigma regulatory factor (Ser/Thr protein kinase)